MVRILLTTAMIIVLNLFVGCQPPNSGTSQLLPEPIEPARASVNVEATSQAEIAEQLAFHREAYRNALEKLVDYYKQTGNQTKLTWAQKELSSLHSMPKYSYIVQASVAGADLKAQNKIREADLMFQEALRYEKKAGALPIGKNENYLRLALTGYNELINKYPSSDKIDDAAYRAAGIYKYLKDYELAVLYYRRTYQWNPRTRHPARFLEARLLDEKLHQKDQALDTYNRALEAAQEGEHLEWVEYAKKRVKKLSKTE